MSPLVFMDTETTGLALDDDIWEFAAIRRENDGSEKGLHLFIEHDEMKCRSLPQPFLSDHLERYPSHGMETSRRDAAHAIANFLCPSNGQKVHIVGAVPNFDTERLALLIRSVRSDTQMPWHHHLIDVENLAVGWMAANRRPVPLPWDSDALSRSVGVEPPTARRHTASGDAEWVRAVYDAVIGGAA